MEKIKNKTSILIYKTTPNLYYHTIMQVKKQYLIVEFIFIASYCIIPPLLKNPNSQNFFQQPNFFSLLIPIFISLILYFQLSSFKLAEKKEKPNLLTIAIKSSYTLKTFGFLIVTSVVINFIGLYFLKIENKNPLIITTPFQFCFLTLTFLVTTFYEEILYRFYLPKTLIELTPSFFQKTFLFEFLPILVFALSHRYLGFLAVINAFIAGYFLRKCYLKSSTIFTGFIAHFLYNFFMSILFILQQKG